LKNFERYYQKSKKVDRREVFFLMAQIWEKRGNGTKAISYYEQYINSGGAVASNVVESAYKIAKINENFGRVSKAEEWYKKTIAIQSRVSKKNAPVGASYAAEARFKQVYKTYEQL